MSAPVTAAGNATKRFPQKTEDFIFQLQEHSDMKVKTDVRAGYGGWERY
ncbi:MAG: hypothetical protein R3F53_14285 [Gammaproteobacteria bacterium]